MKRTHVFGTMIAFTLACSAAGVSAGQETTSQATRSQQKDVVVTGCLMPGAPAASDTGTAGVTGTTGTTGSTGSTVGTSAATPTSFILVNAKMSSANSATGTSGSSTAGGGTTGSTVGGSTAGSTAGGAASGTSEYGSSGANGSAFILTGGQPSELQRYVNSRVEVRGTLDAKSASDAAGGGGTTAGSTGSSTMGSGTTASGAAGSTASSGSGSSNPTSVQPQQLHVTSVRQVAGSCSGGQR